MSTPSQLGPPARAFPLVRHLSYRVTPLLARTELSPNAISIAALAFGLLSATSFARGNWAAAMAGGVLLVACYVLDNCDGEVARLKDLQTPLGKKLDTLIDWVVHAAFFAALGIGATHASGEAIWFWLGGAAAAGATLNFWLGHRRALAAPPGGGVADSPQDSARPESWSQRAIYIFRELTRADFCFIVLALSLLDLTWLLLPVGAIGAQVYWMTGLVQGADRYHV